MSNSTQQEERDAFEFADLFIQASLFNSRVRNSSNIFYF